MRKLAAVTAVVAFVTGSPAVAQELGAPNLSGRVANELGVPLAQVDVRVAGTRMSVQTDEHGTYRFVRAPRGVQTLTFMRIGYLPGALTVNVPDVTDSITLMMVPSRTRLDTMTISAHLNVVGGVVVDARDRPIPYAIVDAIGSATGTDTTDASGWFNFTTPKSGLLLIRARKEGFAKGSYSLGLEGWRGVVLHLDSLPAGMSEARTAMLNGFGDIDEVVWAETQQRFAQRRPGSRVIPREALAPYNGLSLAEAIRKMDVGSRIATALAAADDKACVLEDGYRVVGYVTLASFQVDQVDFVELYPSGTEPTGGVQRNLANAGCTSARASARPSKRSVTAFSMQGSSLETSRGDPLFAVIWFR